jgi:hypothetical protein
MKVKTKLLYNFDEESNNIYWIEWEVYFVTTGLNECICSMHMLKIKKHMWKWKPIDLYLGEKLANVGVCGVLHNSRVM